MPLGSYVSVGLTPDGTNCRSRRLPQWQTVAIYDQCVAVTKNLPAVV